MGSLGGFHYLHHVRPGLSIGVHGKIEINKATAIEENPCLEIGVSYATSPTASFKAKLSTDCTLGLAYIRKIGPVC